MRVDKEFVLREIAGDYIIIPTGKTVLEFNGLITVNEVGVSIWNMLQKEVTFDDLVKGILDEYDVEEQVAREDIREFLDNLISGGILEADCEEKDGEGHVEPIQRIREWLQLHRQDRMLTEGNRKISFCLYRGICRMWKDDYDAVAAQKASGNRLYCTLAG